jgi:hypothetical protein
MSTSDFELASAPTDRRSRDLWLQEAAGFILLRDLKAYAMARLNPELDARSKTIAERAIDDTIYGLMMVIDGVTGAISNEDQTVFLKTLVCCRNAASADMEQVLDLSGGDGMCMGFHRWIAGDFDPAVVAVPKTSP